MIRASRLGHARAAAEAGQRAWIAFGGQADQPWLRPLRPGFRHCFAALQDSAGWTVLDPLSGRLVVARLDLSPGFDLPGFYRRAGFAVLGPFLPGGGTPAPVAAARAVLLCRAVPVRARPRRALRADAARTLPQVAAGRR